jgi:exodeoxyribonuclease VII large subunit
MPVTQKLSEVVSEIEGSIRDRFAGRSFWIKAEITDVKKYADKRWCFLKFVEKSGSMVTTEIKGIFWSNSYSTIELFEKATQQSFSSGLEITCNVSVRFHKRYGLNLEVLEIDCAYAIGMLELERKQTIDRLLREQILMQDINTGSFYSLNSRLELPLVIRHIALITAPDSDGQRDFQKVIRNNKYGYTFVVTEFLTRVQGDQAANFIAEKLLHIASATQRFDIVVIVRGGGSDTDFKSFNDFELVKAVAAFHVPVLTGIGHDRNTSITDLVARQNRTPTETGTFIIDHNMNVDQEIEGLKQRFFRAVDRILDKAKNDIENYKQRVKNLSPATILKKGFAIIIVDDKIVTDPAKIAANTTIKALLKDEIIYSTVTKKESNGNAFDL